MLLVITDSPGQPAHHIQDVGETVHGTYATTSKAVQTSASISWHTGAVIQPKPRF